MAYMLSQSTSPVPNPAKDVYQRAVLDCLPSVALCLDHQGACHFVNRAWTSLTGQPADHAQDSGWLNAVAIEDKPWVRSQINVAILARTSFQLVCRMKRLGDQPGWLQLVGEPLPRGSSGGFVVSGFDVTEQRVAEQRMRHSEERLRKFAEASGEGIIFHEEGLVQDCNSALLRLLGYEVEEVIGHHVLELLAPACRPMMQVYMRSASLDRVHEALALHKNGTSIPVEILGKEVMDQGRRRHIAVLHDIRDRKAAEAKIKFMAHHDALTGLPNRNALFEQMETILPDAKARGQHVAVMFIDLDNFKTVNDSLGHPIGDRLLKVVALRIRMLLAGAAVVSRHGGDEFLVVLPQLKKVDDVVPVAEKLLRVISHRIQVDAHDLAVTPSIGIAMYPQDGETGETLIKHADAAMYAAKDRGRSTFRFFTESLSQSASRALSMESQLRRAFVREEFLLHYQPQVDIKTGKLTGMEALIRWNHPQEGLLMPDQFIAIAEQRGLISAIGSWVLWQACHQNKQWQDQGLAHVPISVNMSWLQIRQHDLVAEVSTVLEQTKLLPRYLCIELTESVLMEDSAAIIQMLNRLKSLGVKIAIDDFGTGYSSLAYLKRYPIDTLKIDRSFVTDVVTDSDDRAIAQAIIQLAQGLKLRTLAEGVENQAQWDLLKELGCDEIQGFMISRAVAQEVMETHLLGLGVEQPVDLPLLEAMKTSCPALENEAVLSLTNERQAC